MEKKNKFDISLGNWTPINHRGVCTKKWSTPFHNLTIPSLLTQFPHLLVWIFNIKDLWSRGSLPPSRGPLHTSRVRWRYRPQHNLTLPPLIPRELCCHAEVPVTLTGAWLCHCSDALFSSLALDEPSWSSAFNTALKRNFCALEVFNNRHFTSIMTSVSALLNLIASYYEFHSGKSPRALPPFSRHCRGTWAPTLSGPWLRFGYAEASLALHQIPVICCLFSH